MGSKDPTVWDLKRRRAGVKSNQHWLNDNRQGSEEDKTDTHKRSTCRAHVNIASSNSNGSSKVPVVVLM